jgi:hypothetical protein
VPKRGNEDPFPDFSLIFFYASVFYICFSIAVTAETGSYIEAQPSSLVVSLNLMRAQKMLHVAMLELEFTQRVAKARTGIRQRTRNHRPDERRE